MIAGILRGVLLRFASEYLSNIDINKISLWSGHVTLQNVNLNASAITNSLNLPYVRLEKGQISSLELNLPWTSLSTKKVAIKLCRLSLDIALTDNLINLNKPPAVSETEESLLSKILANLSIEIEDLSIKISMSEEANYFSYLSISNLLIKTTNSSWQEEFCNPFVTLNNGIAFRIYRVIECTGMNFRVISGRKEESLSEIIIEHKFERGRCGGCPLCFGFKSSSFYSLMKLDDIDLKLCLFTSNEHLKSKNKFNQVEVHTVKYVSDASLQILSAVSLKMNFVNERIARDVGTAIKKSEKPEIKPIEIQEPPSWIAWGKDMLFSPFYCAQANDSRFKDKIAVSDSKLNLIVPSFMVKLRTHNIQELKTFKYVFSSENFQLEQRYSSSESSESVSAKVNDSKVLGNLKNILISCYEKQNCSIFSISSFDFQKTNGLTEYHCKKITTKVIKRGKKGSFDSITLEKLSGSILMDYDQRLKFITDPLTLDISLEELNLVTQSLIELKSFYFRIISVNESDFDEQAERIALSSFKSGTRFHDNNLLEELKQHTSSLALQLEQKTQECSALRQKLIEVAGNSGIAGILNIDNSEIICISENAKIESVQISLVLTQDTLFIITKEGRILNKNPINEMVSLEEKGSNELSIKMEQGKHIRSTLDNRQEMVQSIKKLFSIKST